MLEETRQQPTALAHTLDEGLATLNDLRRRLEANRPRLVVLVARGTSDNAAQFGRYLIEITTHIPVSLAAPSVVTLYASPVDLRACWWWGSRNRANRPTPTRCWRTPAAAAPPQWASPTSRAARMAEISEHMLLARAGKEESVAATKTYTCQLLALYLLAYALGGAGDLRGAAPFAGVGGRVLDLEERVGEIAERYMFMTRAVTVGRGLNYANALEFGLKLMETCYVVTERFSSADLMHGPIALVEHAFPVFVFAPAGVTWQSMSAVLDMLEELKAETLVITDESNTEAASKPARLIRLPIAPVAADGPAGSCTRRFRTSCRRNYSRRNWRRSRG